MSFDAKAKRLLERMDTLPIKRPHWQLALIGGLGLLFDGMDGSLVSYVLPIIKPLWHLNGTQSGLIGSSLLIGIFIGAIGAGVLGDRIGRRRVMMYALALYAVATFIAAFSQNWEFFFTMRVIAGIGIGAESAIIPTFIAEFIPKGKRGLFVGGVAGFFALGYVSSAIIGNALVATNPEGWRIGQILTAVPIAMLLWWRRTLPESPRWLLTQGRTEEAEEVVDGLEQGKLIPARSSRTFVRVAPAAVVSGVRKLPLFRHAELWRHGNARRTAVIWLLWIAVTFSFYGFFVWIPSLLVERGMSVASSFAYSLIITIAQIPGYYSAAFLNERISRKAGIAIYLFGGATAAFLLSQANAPATVIIFGSMLSFFMNGSYAGLYAYTPEVYGTELRATGVGGASAVGRIGGVVAPILVGAAFPQLGFTGVFIMFMIVLGSTALVVLALGLQTSGRSLEDIAGTTVPSGVPAEQLSAIDPTGTGSKKGARASGRQ